MGKILLNKELINLGSAELTIDAHVSSHALQQMLSFQELSNALVDTVGSYVIDDIK